MVDKHETAAEPLSSILFDEEENFSQGVKRRIEEIKEKHFSSNEKEEKQPETVATPEKEVVVVEKKPSPFKTYKKVKMGGKSLKKILFWLKFFKRNLTEQTEREVEKLLKVPPVVNPITLEELVILTPDELGMIREKIDPREVIKEGVSRGLRVFSKQECLELALKLNFKIGKEYICATEINGHFTSVAKDAWLREIFISSPSTCDTFMKDLVCFIFRK